jgi:hypothetical protein
MEYLSEDQDRKSQNPSQHSNVFKKATEEYRKGNFFHKAKVSVDLTATPLFATQAFTDTP